MRILLVTPPLVQCNAPYPATPALTAFLRREGFDAVQADLSLEFLLRVFRRDTLVEWTAHMRRRFRGRRTPETVRHFLLHADHYAGAVDSVLAFLQGRRDSFATRANRPGFLPEGPRFATLRDLERAAPDRVPADPLELARHRASLFLDDLADALRDGVDDRFGFARYAERLAVAAPSFDPLRRALRRTSTPMDERLDRLALDALKQHRPDVVAFTVPFPGAVYAAFRLAQAMRAARPDVVTLLGGGYVNTELRDLTDPRVFEWFDYILLDDGEEPLRRLLVQLRDNRAPPVGPSLAKAAALPGPSACGSPARPLHRTLRRENGLVVLDTDPVARDIPHGAKPAPTYDGLPLDRYPALLETINPMHRLWSERRWNKLQLAHGCYWRKCAFCDTSLDYIRRFDPADAETVVRWMDEVSAETGCGDFHFADEAAPPALLDAVARRLLSLGRRYEWWTNIRFEPYFTPERAKRLREAGCLAVTGGLETAEARTLCSINKGVTLAHAARAARAFSEAGLLVHVYLMYGTPGQTAQETIDGLEFARQLFAAGWVQSCYWHRFALTVHSPLYRNPGRVSSFRHRVSCHEVSDSRFQVSRVSEHETWNLKLETSAPAPLFARNEAPFRDRQSAVADRLAEGLRRAAFNYVHGFGLDEDVRAWFDTRVPRPRLPADHALVLANR